MLAKNLTGQHQPLQIDGDDLVEFLLGNVEKRGGGINPGTVHEDVHGAEPLDHVGQQLLQARLGSGVTGEKLRLAAALGDVIEPRPGLGGVPSDERHGGAGDGDTFGHFPAQHARAANDHGRFAFE